MTDEKRRERELIKQMQKEIKEHPTAIVDQYRDYVNHQIEERHKRIQEIAQRTVIVTVHHNKKGATESQPRTTKAQNQHLANKKSQKSSKKRKPSSKLSFQSPAVKKLIFDALRPGKSVIASAGKPVISEREKARLTNKKDFWNHSWKNNGKNIDDHDD